MDNYRMDNDLEDSLYKRIVSEYLDNDSVEKTAKICGTSKVTVRRVLITEGLWCSKTSIEVGKLHDEGGSVAEIAERLSVTENAVKAYLPYTKGKYGENLTDGAERVKRYRERKEAVAKKMQSMSREITGSDEEIWELESDWHAVSDGSEYEQSEEDWEDKLKRWETERKARLEAECEETRRATEELWKCIRPEPEKISDCHTPQLLRLHIELLGFGASWKEADAESNEKLLKAAKAQKGISRDIIVPENMTLHALHYAIQKLFGFLGYHLNNFSLSREDFNLVTAARVGGYDDLCGVLFRSSDRYEGDEGWDNDYDGVSSVNTWIKKMYRAPYVKGAVGDTWYANMRDVKQRKKAHPEIREDMLLLEADEIEHPSRNRNYLREDMTIGELLTFSGTLKTDEGELDLRTDRREAVKIWKADVLGKIMECESILKHIEDSKRKEEDVIGSFDLFCRSLNQIRLGYEGDDIAYSLPVQNLIFEELAVHPIPFFKELYYTYDYGDNWNFKISAVNAYRMLDEVLPGDDGHDEIELIETLYAEIPTGRSTFLCRAAVKRLRFEDESGREADEELRSRLAECYVYGRPFCVASDGLNLVEDVGSIEGLQNFLLSVNGKPVTEEEKEERRENLQWAKSLGWTGRKSQPEKML